MDQVRAGGRDNPFESISEFEETAPKPKPWPLWVSAAGLLALLLFQHRLLSTWLAAEARPPMWDQAIHLEIAHDYATHLAKGDVHGLLRLAPKPGMPAFPPLYELTLTPWVERPDAVNAALKANYVWFLLFIAAVWGLGILFCGPWEAFAAATLVSCAPEAQWLLRNHLSDMPLAAWIAGCYLAYAWSAGLLRWTGSLAFGACVGGALVTKWSAWTYLFPLAWLWLRALPGRITRWRAIAACGVAVLICAPWYLAQYPMLVPRLIEASADQAVPVWRGWAVFSYLWLLLGGLDTPLWLCAVVAAFVPRLGKQRDDNWMIVAWFVTAFVFWTIVPNRQMRFLFPALAPLMLFTAGVFPKKLVGLLCLWQLFSAANYSLNRIKPIAPNWGRPIPFLTSEPPGKEDWHVAEILKAAESRREAGRPFANLTVVANHFRFNGPVFNWERKHAGVPSVQIRGVNKRWCELSEFVVLKEGELGPASVVNQLPYVRDGMLEQDSWFRQGYEEVKRWKAPDNADLVLYQRRRRASPPWSQASLRLESLVTPQYQASGVVLRPGKWDPKTGSYDKVDLAIDLLVIRGVEVRDVKLELKGADILPLKGPEGLYDVRLLRLEGLSLASAKVQADALAALIARRVPALTEAAVKLDGTAAVSGKVKGRVPFEAEASLRLDPDALAVRLERAKLGPLSLPLPEELSGYRLSFEPSPELPFRLEIAELTLKQGVLKIGP